MNPLGGGGSQYGRPIRDAGRTPGRVTKGVKMVKRPKHMMVG